MRDTIISTGAQDKHCIDPRDLVLRIPTHTEETGSIPFPQDELGTSGSDLASHHSIDNVSFGRCDDHVVLSRVASHSSMLSHRDDFSNTGNSEEIKLTTNEASTPEA